MVTFAAFGRTLPKFSPTSVIGSARPRVGAFDQNTRLTIGASNVIASSCVPICRPFTCIPRTLPQCLPLASTIFRTRQGPKAVARTRTETSVHDQSVRHVIVDVSIHLEAVHRRPPTYPHGGKRTSPLSAASHGSPPPGTKFCPWIVSMPAANNSGCANPAFCAEHGTAAEG